jgi:thiol-disulfide isomerase/thioredoxin
MIRSLALAAAALVCAPSLSFAQTPAPAAAPKPEPTLKPGLAAPALAIDKWLKGAPVANFEKGKVYVVEFWATWCGPCIRGMPHLSKLQKDFSSKGVTFIGVSSEDTRGNTLEKAEKMVADKGDVMAYTVAWDTQRTTYEAYMKAAGQGGIPCCYLVDGEGRIAYIGHPMFLDLPLNRLLAGKWNIDEGTAEMTKIQTALRGVAAQSKTDPKAAVATLNELMAVVPGIATYYGSTHMQLLLDTGDAAGAWKVANALYEEAALAKDVNGLNQVAWTIVDPAKTYETRDLELAQRAAEKGVELSQEKNAAVLDTLARVWAWKGDYKKALEIEKKAEALGDKQFAEDIAKAIEEYTAKLK